jgi:hypothetical protein
MRLLACSGLICFVLTYAGVWAQSAPNSALHSAGKPAEHHAIDKDRMLLLERSTFANGYIHGYEDGFHDSNLEYQLGYGPRELKLFKEYRKGDHGYSKSFGNKKSYATGYRNGFGEGYQDGIRGASFRAVRELREAAAGMSSTSDRATFDAAFANGYQFARKEGPLVNQGVACPGLSAEYCEGFARGYQLGAADVLANDSEQTARVIEKQR